MEFKYLSDGRKVVVIGQLNNIESIVQEVFVTEQGDEVPSGERFTTKSLHDSPVVSWAEKRTKEIEAGLASIKIEIMRYEKERDRKYQELKGTCELVKQALLSIESLRNSKFNLDLLAKFISGNIKYIIIGDYGYDAPVLFEDAMAYYDNDYSRIKFDGIKLITILGRSDGSLEYGIGRYSDGSGSSRTLYPFETYQDAIEHLKNKAITEIEDGKFHHHHLSECLKLGIKFSKKHNKILHKKFMAEIAKRKEKHLEEEAKFNNNIDKDISELNKILD